MALTDAVTETLTIALDDSAAVMETERAHKTRFFPRPGDKAPLFAGERGQLAERRELTPLPLRTDKSGS